MTETGSAAELRAENRLLREELRLREESQIPVIPRGAQAKIDRLEAEVELQSSIVVDVRRILGGYRVEGADATVHAIAKRVGYFLARGAS